MGNANKPNNPLAENGDNREGSSQTRQQKIDALSFKASVQERQLKIERRRVDALRWEIRVTRDIATDSEERIIEMINKKIHDKLGQGILQPFECGEETTMLRTFASILLHHFSDVNEFEKELRNGDCSVEHIVELFQAKAPGLRKDYTRTMMERYACPTAEGTVQKVDVGLLWKNCEEAEKLGWHTKNMKARRDEVMNRLDQLIDENEEEIQKTSKIADMSLEKTMSTSSPASLTVQTDTKSESNPCESVEDAAASQSDPNGTQDEDSKPKSTGCLCFSSKKNAAEMKSAEETDTNPTLDESTGITQSEIPDSETSNNEDLGTTPDGDDDGVECDSEAREATPEPDPVSEKVEEPVAEAKEAAPVPEPVAEKPDEPVAEVKEATPAPEPPAEKAEESVAEVKEATPEPEPVAGETKEPTPEPEPAAEKANEPVAEVNKATPEPEPVA